MTNIRIKTELRKEYTHLSGLKGDIIKIIQQSTSGILKLPTHTSSPTNRSHQFKEAIKNLKNSNLKSSNTKIFSHIEYLKGGQVSFSLSPEAKNLWQKKAFYSIDFDIYTSYSSKFAKGLYELLCCFEGAEIKMNINNIRERINATDSDYLKPTRFMNKVLKPAIEEVEAKSGIKITRCEFDIRGYWVYINSEFPASKANSAIKHNSLFLSMGRLGIPVKWRRLAIRELGEAITKQLIDSVQYEMSDIAQKDREKVRKKRIINRIMAALGIEKKPKIKKNKAAQPNVKQGAKTAEKQPRKVKPMPERQFIAYDSDPMGQSISQIYEQLKKQAIC